MIKDRLLVLPAEIAGLKVRLMETQQKFADIKAQLKSWELIEMSYISNEEDPNGKPKYSNDTKRNAELQHRKDLSEDYGTMELIIKNLDWEISKMNIELDRLLNEQGNLRAICRLEGTLNE